MGPFIDASLTAFYSWIPSGVHSFVETVGWVGIIGFFSYATILIIRDVGRSRREKRLAEEVKINPEVAYQQILSKQEAITEFESKSKKRQGERRAELNKELEMLQKEFKKNFDYADQDALLKKIKDASPANR